MLYIDNIDDNSIRFGNAVGGGAYSKVYPKSLQARKDEINRIWIWQDQDTESVLDSGQVSEITLNGLVYGTAQGFVTAFNNLCSASGGEGSSSVLSRIYNTPGGGEVTSTTATILADTVHSITIICISGTATVTIGSSSIGLAVGESFTWTATGLIDTNIVINASTGAVDYAVIGAAPTTTTTTTVAPTTTTTTV